MDAIIAELTNLATGSHAAGDSLAAKICCDAIQEITRLRAEHERALAKDDGVDYREGHFRDNTTPDELRDIVLGLAIQIDRLRAIVDNFTSWIDVHAIDLREDNEPGNTVQAAWDDAREAAKAAKRGS